MTLTEYIICRSESLRNELGRLQLSHEEMVRDFQTKIGNNQSRFAQINGALMELEQLKGQINENPTPNGDNSTKPDSLVDRFLSPHHRAGDHLGASVVHRELDTPDPAPGEAGAGDHPPDLGDPLGAAEFHGGNVNV